MKKALPMEDWEREERFEQMNGYVSQSDGDEYVGKKKQRPGARSRREGTARVAAQKKVNSSDIAAHEDTFDDDLTQICWNMRRID